MEDKLKRIVWKDTTYEFTKEDLEGLMAKYNEPTYDFIRAYDGSVWLTANGKPHTRILEKPIIGETILNSFSSISKNLAIALKDCLNTDNMFNSHTEGYEIIMTLTGEGKVEAIINDADYDLSGKDFAHKDIARKLRAVINDTDVFKTWIKERKEVPHA